MLALAPELESKKYGSLNVLSKLELTIRTTTVSADLASSESCAVKLLI